MIVFALAAVLVLAACGVTGPVAESEGEDSHAEARAEALDWRERRISRLEEPFGWLSLVGLEFLEDGHWRVGNHPDNDLVVTSGPEHWGEITVAGDRAWFDVAAGSGVRVDGRDESQTEFRPAGSEEPTYIEAGSARLELLERGDRLALRVRDHQAPTRLEFAGLKYFDFDPQWRIEARWVAHPEDRTLLVANVLGELVHEPNPGMAEFEVDGRTFGLEAVDAGEQLFFIFADRTSGRESYGLGRFLYADKPDNGQVVLDFNRAYNPPCAFTEFSTCPLPPPENRLDVAVEAGELTYTGGSGTDPADIQRR